MAGSTDTSWRYMLELRLRRANGNAFQTFFSDIMQARYGSDFVRLKPYGKLGDEGCDGYLQSSGEVFQCYGAQNGSAGQVSTLTAKMNDDFDKAKTNLSEIMACWHMTHNIIEGLPIQAVKTLETLKNANPDLVFGFLGPERIDEIVAELTAEKRDGLLGAAARAADYQNLQLPLVKALIDAVMTSVDQDVGLGDPPEEVSSEKLDHNKLPPHWVQTIQMGRMNHRVIDQYFDRHPEPLRGEQLAQVFRDRYAHLKSQSISPKAIMDNLFDFIAGEGDVPVRRIVAANSILAYLFESCDILENAPEADDVA